MKTKSWIIVNILGISLGLFAISGIVFSDDDNEYSSSYKKGKAWGKNMLRESRLDVAPVKNAFYKEECGSCHFPYQPGLLPARSWERIMGGLADHFGENAELDTADAQQLVVYLTKNSADTSNYKRSRRIAGSLNSNDAPLRVSETRYFQRKHYELPARMVKGNVEVRSFSNCDLCHTRAAQGSYNEHQVKVPGYGSWED